MADVTMPQLGETVTEGTITRWFKQVGDQVNADEPLFEVSTDKVDTEVPSPTAGYVVEIRAGEGDTVDVGAVLAVIGDAPAAGASAPASGAPAAEAPAAEAPAPAEEAPAPAPAAPAPPPPPSPAPATEQPGAPQAPPPLPGQPAQVPAGASAAPSAAPADETPTPAPVPAADGGGANGVLLSPVVRRLVAEHGLDASQLKGSGLGGRITREDVLDAIDEGAGGQAAAAPAAAPAAPEAQAPAPAAPAAAAPAAPAGPAPAPAAPAPSVKAGQRDEVVALSKIRRLTGEHMVMSKAVSPHAFSVVEVDFENVDRVRRRHKDAWKASEGSSLTFLPFIARAVIDAIGEFPHMNASVSGTDLVVHKFVDLGIAVDLDYAGLLVPVIRDADDKRLRAIAREIADLANRARIRKLMPDEISGGTFTISNNGSAGSVLTSAIINQPQVAILSTDAIARKPVVAKLPDGGEAIVIHSVGNLAMTWDHRAFDGAYAAGFLVKIKELLETRDWEAELGVSAPLHVRWLGTVPYLEAEALQRGLFDHGTQDHLLLLEHPHVYTLGVRASMEHVLAPPASVGAELVRAQRGGDVTYHGPGQLVGYPILTLAGKHGQAHGMADTVSYVSTVQQVLIDALGDLGVHGAGRLPDYPGVWLDAESDHPRKVAAIGVRLSRGRTMHGFALNVAPSMAMFGHIVPCGIPDKAVTSLQAEGYELTMAEVVDAVVARAAEHWGRGRAVDRQDVAWRHRPEDLSAFSSGRGPGEPVRLRGRLAAAGVAEGLSISERKPDWLRAKLSMGPEFARVKRTVADLDLVTVCEEAGCPNISECWTSGTATFMVLGERCTRACGFCLVDTRKPLAPDPGEPERVAEAVARMGLAHAVVTMVARDDLPDGGAAHVAAVVEAIRRRRPTAVVEVLISDLRGDPDALDVVLAARPDVVNHNLETVARLQRAVRPSAGYARSLALLARAKLAGATTKTGLVLGMGETDDEVRAVLADAAGVGVDVVTIGQYLRPTTHHLPVQRWVPPATFDELAAFGEGLGIAHVEASPLTRSSYHARQAHEAAAGALDVPVSLSR